MPITDDHLLKLREMITELAPVVSEASVIEDRASGHFVVAFSINSSDVKVAKVATQMLVRMLPNLVVLTSEIGYARDQVKAALQSLSKENHASDEEKIAAIVDILQSILAGKPEDLTEGGTMLPTPEASA